MIPEEDLAEDGPAFDLFQCFVNAKFCELKFIIRSKKSDTLTHFWKQL